MALTGSTISADTLVIGPIVSIGSVPAGPFVPYRKSGGDDLWLVYNASGSNYNLALGCRLQSDGTLGDPINLYYEQSGVNYIEYDDLPSLVPAVAGLVCMTSPMRLNASLIDGSEWRQEDYATLYRLIIEMCD